MKRPLWLDMYWNFRDSEITVCVVQFTELKIKSRVSNPISKYMSKNVQSIDLPNCEVNDEASNPFSREGSPFPHRLENLRRQASPLKPAQVAAARWECYVFDTLCRLRKTMCSFPRVAYRVPSMPFESSREWLGCKRSLPKNAMKDEHHETRAP